MKNIDDIEVIRKRNNILDMRKMYIDVSSVKNKWFKMYLLKKDVIPCFSELSILEIKNEKVYKGIPNEEFVNSLIDNCQILKINNNILNLTKVIIEQEVIPKERYNDALHIAIAKYYRCYTIMYDAKELSEKCIDFNLL